MTCDWGSSSLCGQDAAWVCYPDKFPGAIYACDQHVGQMVTADRAHRLASAPPLALSALKEFVTALAWQAVLLRDSDPLRAANARAAFQTARREYETRRQG